VRSVVALCKENTVPFFFLGNGSNLLVADTGFSGVIIKAVGGYSVLAEDDEHAVLSVGAGMLLPILAAKCIGMGLSGLEFAAGIPGSVGGASVMNAGAYGLETGALIKAVDVLSNDDKILHLSKDKLRFDYRNSNLKESKAYVACVELDLTKKPQDIIKLYTDELMRRRQVKQPLEYRSAGSTFKRPKGCFAGKLIEDAGLKGYRVGDACVSEKHAGFVVNLGNATAADVFEVICHVRQAVYQHSGVLLEPEVEFLGGFDLSRLD
jgi:UDP-N-acetylmuramate dehydrogenase